MAKQLIFICLCFLNNQLVMEFEITSEEIEIQPKTKILSAEELTKYRNVDIEPLRLGLKRTKPSGSSLEAEELQKLHAELKQQISVPRIERLSGRSLAEWDELEQTVRVTRKDGKFGNFGYSRNGQHYLEFFEALFLLELGRLQLEYNQQLMSVEQTYLLLLGEAPTSKLNEYLVYSNFMRVGYILVKHQNSVHQQTEATTHDCIWALLQQAVQNKTIEAHIVQSPHYSKIMQSMDDIKLSIQERKVVSKDLPSVDISTIDFQHKFQQTVKRKAAAPLLWNNKRSRYQANTTHPQQSYLDLPKNEPEYEQFQKIFEKFDIIQLQLSTKPDAHCRQFQIHFDVHLHNDGFKKSSPKAPNFRLILLQPNEAFPTHAELSNCYHQQQLKVPLLIVSISESKQIQAFLYFFT